jgi:hypothetical protein
MSVERHLPTVAERRLGWPQSGARAARPFRAANAACTTYIGPTLPFTPGMRKSLAGLVGRLVFVRCGSLLGRRWDARIREDSGSGVPEGDRFA